ncbi:GNAT family N-acetyltransferase [Photobacterium makurazakiensis]|uniref:GNAT family N-acetyltransferase n=1 Tax=Photobacterium makurazakiensis TaxID=2910234 RepID=UPI003D0EE70B
MIETDRLILRQWRDSDLAPFAEMNRDPKVMTYFPSLLSARESNELAERFQRLIVDKGWGFWALEQKNTGLFLGFVGLHFQEEGSGIPNAPLVEIGWRLCSSSWGNGFAPEAAKAALAFAFDTLNLSEVYAFTALQNLPSKRVMEKIGMHNTHQDFNHPKLPKGHPLERHCLYRIQSEALIK